MAYPTLWTAQVKSAFLAALTESGEIIAACQAVNLSPQGAYRHRSLDPEFARAWDVAKLHSKEVVFGRLTSRALDGWQENVYYRGELVGTRQRHDNRLILALIARLDKLAPPTPAAPATLRAAENFAAVLDDLAADQPLDAHFAPTREEREAIMIRRVESRATYQHYATLMTLEEQEWVNGGPLYDFDDDELCDEEDVEDVEDAETVETAAPDGTPLDHPVAPAPEPGPLSDEPTPSAQRPTATGPGSSPTRPDDQNPPPFTSLGGHHSSSLLNETTAPCPTGEDANHPPRTTPGAAEAAEDARVAALFDTARTGRFGEMTSTLDRPDHGPRIRML